MVVLQDSAKICPLLLAALEHSGLALYLRLARSEGLRCRRALVDF